MTALQVVGAVVLALALLAIATWNPGRRGSVFFFINTDSDNDDGGGGGDE